MPRPIIKTAKAWATQRPHDPVISGKANTSTLEPLILDGGNEVGPPSPADDE